MKHLIMNNPPVRQLLAHDTSLYWTDNGFHPVFECGLFESEDNMSYLIAWDNGSQFFVIKSGMASNDY